MMQARWSKELAGLVYCHSGKTGKAMGAAAMTKNKLENERRERRQLGQTTEQAEAELMRREEEGAEEEQAERGCGAIQ